MMMIHLEIPNSKFRNMIIIIIIILLITTYQVDSNNILAQFSVNHGARI